MFVRVLQNFATYVKCFLNLKMDLEMAFLGNKGYPLLPWLMISKHQTYHSISSLEQTSL
jgi:hypothetical protein